ncbi:hypothetical protein [Brasilonema bromeliae]|uniref:Uncharacterized protein n=1 Tax=Brasilonema bromeliae SPC951 TaxID=385972 RepID=A0ABX1PG82_9CYAN|nr:hypothetical protein [Brasilonema bromeliae]NMG22958.1 hypothetical protein [Brasilonema bromeliae SPC951]
MNPLDVIRKIEESLKTAADLASGAGADTLDAAAGVLDKISHATHDFADFLRNGGHSPTPAPADGSPASFAAAPTSAEVVACCDRLDALKAKCTAAAAPRSFGASQPVGANPVVDALIAQLVAATIEAVTGWFRRKFPQA